MWVGHGTRPPEPPPVETSSPIRAPWQLKRRWSCSLTFALGETDPVTLVSVGPSWAGGIRKHALRSPPPWPNVMAMPWWDTTVNEWTFYVCLPVLLMVVCHVYQSWHDQMLPQPPLVPVQPRLSVPIDQGGLSPPAPPDNLEKSIPGDSDSQNADDEFEESGRAQDGPITGEGYDDEEGEDEEEEADDDEEDDDDDDEDEMAGDFVCLSARGHGSGGDSCSSKSLSRRQRKNRKSHQSTHKHGGDHPMSPGQGKASKITAPGAMFRVLALSKDMIYATLNNSDYLLTQNERIILGYPQETKNPGQAKIFKDPQSNPTTDAFARESPSEVPDIVPQPHLDLTPTPDQQSLKRALDANAREFVPGRIGSAPDLVSMTNSWNPDSDQPPPLQPIPSSPRLRATAREFVPSRSVFNRTPSHRNVVSDLVLITSSDADDEGIVPSHGDPLVKKCIRCKKRFRLSSPSAEICVYHYGKIRARKRKRPPIYTCCGVSVHDRAQPGCFRALCHVWSGIDMPKARGFVGPFKGYVSTSKPECFAQNPGVFALDCEMGFTTVGFELIRVTVVEVDGSEIYDSLVWTEHPILDYNTKFSGITHRDMERGSPKSLKQVQTDLLELFNSETILVGHALENDLRALKLFHTKICDTSSVFPHEFGLPYRTSLRLLAKQKLHIRIQEDESGHDSYEDARISMDLILWKLLDDHKEKMK
ncbi:hypothetical protein TCAL_06530 [Tigriopus californicus]|uniref:Exonuclease domain-containing protein n=1 Tax=Tigriopus californicus TaxID=6832 RepID=A0A553P092_TIGCA|nr:uncharacterized protein LOC131886388 [Tigriopus californicus]TRY71097.1 hypothetical protein TCAL_06530 [Tigriopus californicus]|eukprot:TCALIF_06530-PA protein Name:"Similar to REXO1L1 Putative exonuclease GOR (Homo sapiens)" AED:0.00 eAED:0.00 QI:605/1/1/1/1/1/2/298/702